MELEERERGREEGGKAREHRNGVGERDGGWRRENKRGKTGKGRNKRERRGK